MQVSNTQSADGLPLVSVCIGSYNHSAYLRECLDSVFEQTYWNFEVVVVDDASSDDTAEILAEYAVRYPQQFRYEIFTSNVGVSKVFNRAFSMASSEYIATLGSDDRMQPQRLERQLELMLERPDCVACFTQVNVIDAKGATHAHALGLAEHFNQPIHDLRWQLLENNIFNGPSLMLRKSSFLEAGGYLGVLKYVQDFDLYIRLLEKGSLLRVEERLTDYRVHNSNLSVSFSGSEPAIGLEMLGAIVNAARIWPLQSLFEGDLSRLADKASAMVKLAVHLQRMDSKYARRTSIGTAHAYQLAIQACRLDPSVAAELKASLESELKALSEPSVVTSVAPLRPYQLRQAQLVLSSVQYQSYLEQFAEGQAIKFSFVIFHDGASALALSDTLATCVQQYFACARVVVVSPRRPEGLMASIGWVASGELLATSAAGLIDEKGWLLFLRSGDRLDRSGFVRAVCAIQFAADWRCCYFDEDAVTVEGHTNPLYRPDFNLDLLRSYPYMGAVMAFETVSFFEAYKAMVTGGGWSLYEQVFRLFERHGARAIGHVAEVVVHACQRFNDWLSVAPEASDFPQALQRHLQRSGIAFRLASGTQTWLQRVYYLHDGDPLVSIIIYAKQNLMALQLCLESLIEHTGYSLFEIIVIDAFSDDAAAHYLSQLVEVAGGRVISVQCKHGDSETEALSQVAAFADGEYLLFLDQQVNALRSDWLDTMLNHARRQDIGAVGARLCYPDGSTYHGGLVLGLNGLAGRAFHGAPIDHPGYMFRLQADHQVSAVDSACLLVSKVQFETVGGFSLGDEAQHLSREMAALDLCLKITQSGQQIVFAADAFLMYRQDELGPQPSQCSDATETLFFQRWLPLLANDPAYNKNFSRHGAGFELEPSARLSVNFLPPAISSRGICFPGDLQGSGHYRLIQPCDHLVRAGLLDGECSDTFHDPLEMQRYRPDVVVLQRQVSEVQEQAIERIARFSGAYRIYDVDDYLFDLPQKSVHRDQMPKDLEQRLRRIFSRVDRLVVSTAELADAFSDAHSNIHVVNNYLPPCWWKGWQPLRQAGRKPRVGWAGGISHTGDLEMIFEVVREMADEVEWVFLGMCPDQLFPYVHEFHSGVAIDQYPAKLASLNLDLALAPLVLNRFNQCKSNLRLLEYGACGYPVICTDIHPYQCDLPVTRVANRKQDWLEAIRDHLADLDQSAAAGERLRQAVFNGWMLEGDNLLRWRQAWRPGN